MKFSTLIKILSEKQNTTEVFIEEQRQAAISDAEARLAELEERAQKLKESQGQIAALHNLSDTELIKVSTLGFNLHHQSLGLKVKVMHFIQFISLKCNIIIVLQHCSSTGLS